MDESLKSKRSEAGHYVYCRYITKNGVRIYPRRGKVFRFWVAA